MKKKTIKFLVYQNLVKEERLRSFDLNTVHRFVEAENEREAINKFIAATGHLPCIREFAPIAINQDMIRLL